MAEELRAASSAVGDGDPTGSSQPTGGEQAGRQPKQKVNLDELPEFRQWKSKSDQAVQTARNEARAAQQAAQRMEQQLQQMQLANVDEDQRPYIQLQQRAYQAEQRAIAAEQELQRQTEAAKIQKIFNKITNTTGMPMEDVEKLFYEDRMEPDDIWEAAAKYQKDGRRNRKRQDEEEEDDDADRVDLGSGRNRSAAADLEAKIQQALKDKDPVLYTRLLRQQRKG